MRTEQYVSAKLEERTVEFICEWCEPSDMPETNPERCQIRLCPIHGRTWHWPTSEANETERR